MKVASLVMVGQTVNVTSLMGMALMTEPTLVLRVRRMTVTTLPSLHSQVSTVTLCVCVCVHVWKWPCYVGCVHECAAIINIPLSAHCMPCSFHVSNVQSRSLTMSNHTPCECYVCGPLSACISCAFSVYLCSRPLV